jgi:hypothetical protein
VLVPDLMTFPVARVPFSMTPAIGGARVAGAQGHLARDDDIGRGGVESRCGSAAIVVGDVAKLDGGGSASHIRPGDVIAESIVNRSVPEDMGEPISGGGPIRNDGSRLDGNRRTGKRGGCRDFEAVAAN